MTPDHAPVVILFIEACIYGYLVRAVDQRRRAYIAMRDRLHERQQDLWEQGFRRGYIRGYDEGMRIAYPGAEQIAIQQVPLRPDGTADAVRLAEMIAEQIATSAEAPAGPLPGSRLHGNPRVN